MAKEFDLVIRNGTIVDGTGAKPFIGDIAVAGGVIARVGDVAATGSEEVDAKHRIVTPGFVALPTAS